MGMRCSPDVGTSGSAGRQYRVPAPTMESPGREITRWAPSAPLGAADGSIGDHHRAVRGREPRGVGRRGTADEALVVGTTYRSGGSDTLSSGRGRPGRTPLGTPGPPPRSPPALPGRR